jgi:hypothetical protein
MTAAIITRTEGRRSDISSTLSCGTANRAFLALFAGTVKLRTASLPNPNEEDEALTVKADAHEAIMARIATTWSSLQGKAMVLSARKPGTGKKQKSSSLM